MNRPASALRSEVLIVDPSEESREVFRTVLARRGLMTLEATSMDDGLELTRRYRPRVVVLDIDDECPEKNTPGFAAYQQQCARQDSALLVLGVTRDAAASLVDGQVVRKPYHYGPLIRKIEQLCRQSLDADQRASSAAAG